MTPESIRVTLYRLEELPDLEHAVKLNDDITKNQTIVGGRNAIVCYGRLWVPIYKSGPHKTRVR